MSQFELFELILLLKLDKQFPVEQCEATVSQSTAPSPPSCLCGAMPCPWTAGPAQQIRIDTVLITYLKANTDEKYYLSYRVGSGPPQGL